VQLGYRFASYPGLELLGGLEQVEPESDSGLESETRLSAGLRYNFGGKGNNSYTNLFPEDSGRLRPRMRLEDAVAVAGTNSITLQGRKNIGRANITEIDKNLLRQQLDGLIQQAQGLQQVEYTALSWSNLSAGLNTAIQVRSNGESTWPELTAARTNLQAALSNLEKNSAPLNSPPSPTFTAFTMNEDGVKNGMLTATDPQ